ncbi:hypothetical protein SAMN02745203_00330 [Porphyromonas crevioricanis]|nr:hypothetical protein SAMN02745203_00330 [Porphyromonas crevioricanis]
MFYLQINNPSHLKTQIITIKAKTSTGRIQKKGSTPETLVNKKLKSLL